ncbi:hypothetical protein [Streptosporangium sp. NPDC051022]|uniref:hypothetical protein n=1 Tax=Streptosporangium sp. NPDC051022 TaxID=3155752 RepID=UPI003419E99E
MSSGSGNTPIAASYGGRRFGVPVCRSAAGRTARRAARTGSTAPPRVTVSGAWDVSPLPWSL